MSTVVGVVFSPGGKVYSFDPGGLELGWNERVICQTMRGQELGRVVKPNHEPEGPPETPLKKVVRRATELDRETHEANRLEARRAMGVFREVVREHGIVLKPVSAELVFDGSRVVFAYEAEQRPDVGRLQGELRRRLHRRIELRAVGPGSPRVSAGTTGSAGRSTAAAASRRTRSRSPCEWPRIRTSP